MPELPQGRSYGLAGQDHVPNIGKLW